MKNCLIIGSLAVVVLFFAGYAFAGDSVSIRVSCSIPAIPGVNAPALDSEKETIEKEAVEEEVEQGNKKKKEDKLLLTKVTENEDGISYTIYSR